MSLFNFSEIGRFSMSLFNFSEIFHNIVGKHQLFRFNKEK